MGESAAWTAGMHLGLDADIRLVHIRAIRYILPSFVAGVASAVRTGALAGAAA
jgi:hypothetical protein